MKRLILVPIALLLLLAATPPSGANAAWTQMPTSLHACGWGALRVTAGWSAVNAGIPGGGAAVGQITFTKITAGSCTLKGSPTVRLYDAHMARLPVTWRKSTAETVPQLAVLSGSGQFRTAHVSLEWHNWCKASVALPISLKVRLPGKAVFHRVSVNPGGNVKASCVNPTVGSVIDVGPFER